LAAWAQPVAGSQVSSVQAIPSSQATGLWTHRPIALHRPVVQASPSSQPGRPFVQQAVVRMHRWPQRL
jgi:hypothetical protein